MSWGSISLKRIAKLIAGGTPAIDEPNYWSEGNDGLAWSAIGDMSNVDFVTRTGRRVSEEGLRSARIKVGKPGTILFSMYASLGHTAWLAIPAAWNQAILGLQADERTDARFLRYSLIALRPSLMEMARSSTQANLNAEQVANLPIPHPTLETQRRIADFLDCEIGRVDRVHEMRRKTLELLLDRRSAVNSEWVLGAASFERRPSTLPWASEIPASWAEVKLSYVAKLGSGHTPSRNRPDYWEDCTIPWVTTGEVSQMRSDRLEYLETTREMISNIGLENSAAEIHPAGTVVLCRTAASAGYSAIMATDMATSQDIATWTCGPRLRPEYLLWCLRVMRRDLLDRLAMGSTHRTIYMPDLQDLRIPLPEPAEQHEIVMRVRESNALIDRAIDAIGRQIGLLAERRQALIAAAVTGQIDVSTARGAAV